MRVVLYTQDFEPITVLDLPTWALNLLDKRIQVNLAVPSPIDMCLLCDADVGFHTISTVFIRSQRLRWTDGTMKQILLTDQEEGVLALESSWLPDQQRQVNRGERDIRGLAAMLVQALGDKL